MKDTVSKERLRGVRIFDITDIAHPEERRQRADLPRLAHAHACWSIRRTRTTSTSTSPARRRVRSPSELPGCVDALAVKDPELGAVPDRGHQGAAGASGAGGHRELAAHLQRPRGAAEARRRAGGHRRQREGGRRGAGDRRLHRGTSTAQEHGAARQFVAADARQHREGRGTAPARRRRPTARRCAQALPAIIDADDGRSRRQTPDGPRPGPRSATTSPSIRRSGSPAARAPATACCSTSAIRRIPVRIGAVADSNFSYWHSATFNNDGTKILFSRRVGRRRRSRSAARRTSTSGAPTRSSRSTNRQAAVPELLQAAGGADAAGELRRAQRLADPDSRAAT